MFVQVTVALVILIGFASTTSHMDDNDKPNIIYLMFDDLGYTDVGFTQNELYNKDETIYFSTPTIDKLATQRGIIFDRYYVHPLCTATRAAFLTGRYPFRYGYEFVALPWQDIELNQVLFPTLLSKYGNYNTLHSGKWHLGQKQWINTPNQYFDEWLSVLDGNAHYYRHSFCLSFDSFFWSPMFNFEIEDESLYSQLKQQYPNPLGKCYYTTYEGINKPYQNPETYNNDIYIEEAFYTKIEDFIISNNNKNPFFIWWSPITPHWKIEYPPNTFKSKDINYKECDNIINNEKRLIVCQMIQYMDILLKNLIKLLKNLDLWDNTLIIVSSDNGGDYYLVDQENPTIFGDASSINFPLRGRKGNVFDGGIRSPAFITGGFIPKPLRGTHYSGLFGIEDWFLTLINLAKIDINSIDKQILDFDILDSYDQWWHILEHSKKLESHDLSVDISLSARNEWINLQSNGLQLTTIITNSGWKYMIYGAGNVGMNSQSADFFPNYYNTDGTENDFFNDFSEHQQYMLFDLFNDPYETTNIINDYQIIANNLQDKINDYASHVVNTEMVLLRDGLKSAVETGTMVPWYPQYINVTESVDQILTQLLL